MREALEKWKKADFDQAIHLLRQALADESVAKTSVLNNLAVVEWNPLDSKSTQSTLEALENAAAGHASASDTKDEGSSLQKRRKIKSALDVITYNRAVVKFRQQLHDEVISLLEPVFDTFQIGRNGLLIAGSFLLMEAYLESGLLSKCAILVESLEMELSKVRNVQQQENMKEWNKIFSPVLSISDHLQTTSPDVFNLPLDLQTFALPVVSELTLSSDDCSSSVENEELCRPQQIMRQNAFIGAQTLFGMKRFDKVHEVLAGIHDKASCFLTLDIILLKAQTYLAAGKAEMSFKVLTECMQQLPKDDDILRSYVLNNTGIVYLKLEKENLAAMCFLTSIRSYHNQILMGDIKENYYRNLYNSALLSLQKGHFSEALSHFNESLKLLYQKPYIWFRMAECCIGLAQQAEEDPMPAIKRIPRYDITLPSVCILPTSDHTSLKSKSHPIGQNLLRANAYLQNALVLAQTFPDEHLLKASIFLKLAYVTLALDQPERCLFYVKKLKALENIFEDIAFYGTLYEVEALCYLDESKEAAHLLRIKIDCAESKAWNLSTARHGENSAIQLKWSMLHNLAAVYCTNHEFSNARAMIQKALNIEPNNSQSILLLLYIEIVDGNLESALNIIHSQHF